MYSIDDVAVTKESGESSLEACERYMKAYEAEKTDLTGCTLDQVLYVINKGCPVIALTSADHAILMTGYSKTDITYFDPDTGELLMGDIVISVDKVKEQAEKYGHSQTRELAFLVAHSMLHLSGYDHMEDDERIQMEDMQREILERRGYRR